MYLVESLINGLKILAFDKETIKKISRERSLEEIFLSTLFLNYIIVLVIYLIGLAIGAYSIEGREVNMKVLFGLLIIYPFIYNLFVYGIYGFFGFIAEHLNKKKTIKPLISVGFHTAFVYSILLYIVALGSTFNITTGGFIFAFILIYFIYTMFAAISTIYELSFEKTLIVLFVPFLVFGIILLTISMLVPQLSGTVLNLIFN